MKVNDVIWFAGISTVGLVQVDDEYEGIKYYIGAANGLDEEVDKEYISVWGARFPKNVGDILFGGDDLRNGNAVQVPMSKEQAEMMIRVGNLYLEQHA